MDISQKSNMYTVFLSLHKFLSQVNLLSPIIFNLVVDQILRDALTGSDRIMLTGVLHREALSHTANDIALYAGTSLEGCR